MRIEPHGSGNHHPARGAPITAALALSLAGATLAAKPRLIVETDIGGDKDDQASLVRLLIYSNDIDLEGILCDRSDAAFQKDGAAMNPTGAKSALEMARHYIDAYGKVRSNLVVHSPDYPTTEELKSITVAAHNGTQDGVNLILRALEKNDPRPLWYNNWGSNSGTTSNLKRALDKLKTTKSKAEYEKLSGRLRICSLDGSGPTRQGHEGVIELHVETGYPDMDGGRWYHRFASLVGASAGDVTKGHGDLGKLWTGSKEGDTWTFLYLIPTGLGDPEDPTLGGWAGRYGKRTKNVSGDAFYWPDLRDEWNGSTNRDNTVKRWRDAPRRDFKARMDWCVIGNFADANHRPEPMLQGEKGLGMVVRKVRAGDKVTLDASGSTDPDKGQSLSYRWEHYREAGTYGKAVAIQDAEKEKAGLVVPSDFEPGQDIHIVLSVTDNGKVPLTRHRRLILESDATTRASVPGRMRKNAAAGVAQYEASGRQSPAGEPNTPSPRFEK